MNGKILAALIACLPAAAEAATVSWRYIGAEGAEPYTGWDGTRYFRNGGWLSIDTAKTGSLANAVLEHYPTEYRDYDTGVRFGFDFGVSGDLTDSSYRLAFDASGGLDAWSFGSVWWGPSWFADFATIADTGESWIQLDGPFSSYTIWEARPGSWTLSSIREDPYVEPQPQPVPVPAGIWLIGAALGLLGFARCRGA